MQIISRFPTGEPREVELTDLEQRASAKFELALDLGHDIRIATHLTRLCFAPAISEEFLAWKAG